ncbi:MAG: hypothetical protein SGI74_11075 [Oligoflexia bacterium]|nr:hypothetical protein [Oligoflexia bacterium]
MSNQQKNSIAPFISIVFLVVIGLMYVFVKMEAVREGYEVLRLGRIQKLVNDEKVTMELAYTKLIRPERLDQIGTQRLALMRAQKNQVILMAATGSFAIRR